MNTVIYYYPVGNELCHTTNYTLARKRMSEAMGRDCPVIATLSANKVAKFKDKFRKK